MKKFYALLVAGILCAVSGVQAADGAIMYTQHQFVNDFESALLGLMRAEAYSALGEANVVELEREDWVNQLVDAFCLTRGSAPAFQWARDLYTHLSLPIGAGDHQLGEGIVFEPFSDTENRIRRPQEHGGYIANADFDPEWKIPVPCFGVHLEVSLALMPCCGDRDGLRELARAQIHARVRDAVLSRINTAALNNWYNMVGDGGALTFDAEAINLGGELGRRMTNGEVRAQLSAPLMASIQAAVAGVETPGA